MHNSKIAIRNVPSKQEILKMLISVSHQTLPLSDLNWPLTLINSKSIYYILIKLYSFFIFYLSKPIKRKSVDLHKKIEIAGTMGWALHVSLRYFQRDGCFSFGLCVCKILWAR